jgi:putative (di)nucleoside polyphosphate hydrolase
MRLDADDSHINIATPEPEFSAWQWLEVHQLPEMIVPFKQQLYRDIIREFTPYIL